MQLSLLAIAGLLATASASSQLKGGGLRARNIIPATLWPGQESSSTETVPAVVPEQWAPTADRCGDTGLSHVHLELRTNKRPQMISWKIIDACSGRIVEERGHDAGYDMKYFEENHVYKEDYCVPRSMYKFVIKEAQRRIATPYEEAVYGKGEYTLFQDKEVAAKGNSMNAAWTRTQSTPFGSESCPPTGSPTVGPTQAPFQHDAFCPGKGSAHFHLDLKTHGSPMQIHWRLTDTCTDEVLATAGGPNIFNMYYDRHTLYKEDFCLPPSEHRRYKFHIWTENGGGLCCDNHPLFEKHGYYTMKEDGIVVAEGGSNMTETEVPYGDMGGHITHADEVKEYGKCDDGWVQPEIIPSPGDISDGKCQPCAVEALVAGCIPCEMFRDNKNGMPEKCRVKFCEDMIAALETVE